MQLALLGEPRQGDQPAGEGVAGGLVAGDEQDGEEREQLVVLEPVLLLGHLGPVLVAHALDRLVLLGEVAGVEGLGEDRDDVVRRGSRDARR